MFGMLNDDYWGGTRNFSSLLYIVMARFCCLVQQEQNGFLEVQNINLFVGAYSRELHKLTLTNKEGNISLHFSHACSLVTAVSPRHEVKYRQF